MCAIRARTHDPPARTLSTRAKVPAENFRGAIIGLAIQTFNSAKEVVFKSSGDNSGRRDPSCGEKNGAAYRNRTDT
jgi:hypothetical protein